MKVLRRERWVDVYGFDGVYKISSIGRVLSLQPWKRTSGKPHYLSRTVQPSGHHFARLWRDGKTVNISLGKLMLLSFVGVPVPPRIWACHDDGDPTNNRIGNLYWGTNSENQMDRVRHGTSNRGAANGCSKITEADATDIKRRIRDGERNCDIHVDYPHVDCSMISAIRIGRNWGHLVI